MTRAEFQSQLSSLDLADHPEQDRFRQQMLQLLQLPDCFQRSCLPGHFTGSALVVNADGSRVLLNHHRRLNRWMQFGGHCDGDSDLPRVAAREAFEESGISGLIIASTRPFDLDIHPIPANPARGEPEHFHYDVRYVLIAPEGAQFAVSDESYALGWFTAEEARTLDLDTSVLRLLDKWQQLVARRAH